MFEKYERMPEGTGYTPEEYGLISKGWLSMEGMGFQWGVALNSNRAKVVSEIALSLADDEKYVREIERGTRPRRYYSPELQIAVGERLREMPQYQRRIAQIDEVLERLQESGYGE